MSRPSARHQHKHRQRLAWLNDHRELLAALPGAHDDVDPLASEVLDIVLRKMTSVLLYPSTMKAEACRWNLRRCVSELRGEAVPTFGGKGRGAAV